jgi:hypothetical protein
MSERNFLSLEERLKDLEDKFKQQSLFERVVKSLSMGGAVVVFAVSGCQYLNNQEDESLRNADLRENEFKRTFWETRLSLYTRATSAASRIATAPDPNSAPADVREFWELYYGELALVEDESVAAAMVNFGEELSEGNKEALKGRSYDLALSCRDSLMETWNPVDIAKLPPRRIVKGPTAQK